MEVLTPKRAVLIYVGIGVAGFNANRPKGDREGAWLAHGIASIGASLLQAGHDVELIDLRHFSGWDEVFATIRQKSADVYGLSVSPVDSQFAIPIATAVKHFHPAARVVVGGIHPTIFPERYNDTAIDCVVVGEGELTMLDLLSATEWPRMIRGRKPDLDVLPWVERELFDYRRELDCVFAPDQRTPSVTMLAGRGCPYFCNYCQPAENAVFGKPHRIRKPDGVVAELRFLKEEYDFKSITFWDDTFTMSKKWVADFCDLYERENFGATIAACSRADIVCKNEAMVERLASLGCDWFVIGLESGSQRILDLLQKGTTVEQNIEAARICRKHGIKIFGTYMYGLPTETKEEALATARMIDEIQPEHASPFFFSPIEGTGIYQFCKDNELLLGEGGSVARTGVFRPAIKGVDYEYLNALRFGHHRGGDHGKEGIEKGLWDDETNAGNPDPQVEKGEERADAAGVP